MGMGMGMGNLMGGNMGSDINMGNVMGVTAPVTGLNSIQKFGNVSRTQRANNPSSKLPTGVSSSNNMSMYASVRNY